MRSRRDTHDARFAPQRARTHEMTAPQGLPQHERSSVPSCAGCGTRRNLRTRPRRARRHQPVHAVADRAAGGRRPPPRGRRLGGGDQRGRADPRSPRAAQPSPTRRPSPPGAALSGAARTSAPFAHSTGAAPGHDGEAALAAPAQAGSPARPHQAVRVPHHRGRPKVDTRPGDAGRAALSPRVHRDPGQRVDRAGYCPDLDGGPLHGLHGYEPADPEGSAVTTVELPHARLVLADATDVEIYRAMFEGWQGRAVAGGDAGPHP